MMNTDEHSKNDYAAEINTQDAYLERLSSSIGRDAEYTLELVEPGCMFADWYILSKCKDTYVDRFILRYGLPSVLPGMIEAAKASGLAYGRLQDVYKASLFQWQEA